MAKKEPKKTGPVESVGLSAAIFSFDVLLAESTSLVKFSLACGQLGTNVFFKSSRINAEGRCVCRLEVTGVETLAEANEKIEDLVALL